MWKFYFWKQSIDVKERSFQQLPIVCFNINMFIKWYKKLTEKVHINPVFTLKDNGAIFLWPDPILMSWTIKYRGRKTTRKVVDIKQELFKRSREQGQEKTNISPLGKRDKRDFSMFSSSASFLFPSPASASAPSPLTSFPYLGDNHGQWSWSSMMMCFLVEMIVTWPQNDFPKLGKK